MILRSSLSSCANVRLFLSAENTFQKLFKVSEKIKRGKKIIIGFYPKTVKPTWVMDHCLYTITNKIFVFCNPTTHLLEF